MAKRALGKGLAALISTPVTHDGDRGGAGEADEGRRRKVMEIPLSVISPNPFQPRKVMDGERLAPLVDSIREHGVLQPIVVSPVENGYQIVVGERRYRATKEAGLKRIPVVVKETRPQQLLELALVENLQREDLNPLEEAEAYRLLMREFRLTQEQVAKRIGKSRPAVANALRLLDLSPLAKDALMKGALSAGHARALIGISDETLLEKILKKIETEGLSVRQVEAMVRAVSAPAQKPPPEEPEQGEYDKFEEDLSSFLGTQVRVKQGRRLGVIQISCQSRELERLLTFLLGRLRASSFTPL